MRLCYAANRVLSNLDQWEFEFVELLPTELTADLDLDRGFLPRGPSILLKNNSTETKHFWFVDVKMGENQEKESCKFYLCQ